MDRYATFGSRQWLSVAQGNVENTRQNEMQSERGRHGDNEGASNENAKILVTLKVKLVLRELKTEQQTKKEMTVKFI